MIKRFKWFVRRVFGIILFTPVLPFMIVTEWVVEDNKTLVEAFKKVWTDYKEFAWGIVSEQ